MCICICVGRGSLSVVCCLALVVLDSVVGGECGGWMDRRGIGRLLRSFHDGGSKSFIYICQPTNHAQIPTHKKTNRTPAPTSSSCTAASPYNEGPSPPGASSRGCTRPLRLRVRGLLGGGGGLLYVYYIVTITVTDPFYYDHIIPKPVITITTQKKQTGTASTCCRR